MLVKKRYDGRAVVRGLSVHVGVGDGHLFLAAGTIDRGAGLSRADRHLLSAMIAVELDWHLQCRFWQRNRPKARRLADCSASKIILSASDNDCNWARSSRE